MGVMSAYRVSKPRSRVRGYWIRAELRRLRRQARSSGVPLQVLISRNLNLTESPEEAVPLALAEVLPADQADDRMVEEISKRVTSHIVQRLKSERANPRALAREVARLLAERMAGAAPATPKPATEPMAEAAKPKRISIDDIEGMIDQILKENQ